MALFDSVADCVSSPFLNSIAGLHNTELISSPNAYSKLDSFDQKQKLETEFCRDFSCCGLNLGNLHQLLEHYEEFHLSHSSGSSSEDDEYDNSSKSKNPNRIDGLLLQQPIQLAHITPSFSSKEHLTKYDINMLENAKKYSSRKTVQTLDSIVGDLNTPSLSPSENRFRDYFDKDAPTGNQWAQQPIVSSEDTSDKPYRCLVPDCDKAYKNANGLKYHRLHGHCPPSDGSDSPDASKPYNCSMGTCRKRYKNLNGLKYHIEHTHFVNGSGLNSDMFIRKTVPENNEDLGSLLATSRKRDHSSIDSPTLSPSS